MEDDLNILVNAKRHKINQGNLKQIIVQGTKNGTKNGLIYFWSKKNQDIVFQYLDVNQELLTSFTRYLKCARQFKMIKIQQDE